MTKIYIKERRIHIDMEPSTHLEYDCDRTLEDEIPKIPSLTNDEKNELLKLLKEDNY